MVKAWILTVLVDLKQNGKGICKGLISSQVDEWIPILLRIVDYFS